MCVKQEIVQITNENKGGNCLSHNAKAVMDMDIRFVAHENVRIDTVLSDEALRDEPRSDFRREEVADVDEILDVSFR